MLETLGELHAKGVDLYLHRQGIDTRTPGGEAMFQMLGVFAEFEREVIRERINAGIARARLKGTKSGAPIGRAPTPPHVVTAIRKTLAKGTGIIKTAKLHGVGVGTMQRIKQLWLECLDTLDRNPARSFLRQGPLFDQALGSNRDKFEETHTHDEVVAAMTATGDDSPVSPRAIY